MGFRHFFRRASRANAAPGSPSQLSLPVGVISGGGTIPYADLPVLSAMDIPPPSDPEGENLHRLWSKFEELSEVEEVTSEWTDVFDEIADIFLKRYENWRPFSKSGFRVVEDTSPNSWAPVSSPSMVKSVDGVVELGHPQSWITALVPVLKDGTRKLEEWMKSGAPASEFQYAIDRLVKVLKIGEILSRSPYNTNPMATYKFFTAVRNVFIIFGDDMSTSTAAPRCCDLGHFFPLMLRDSLEIMDNAFNHLNAIPTNQLSAASSPSSSTFPVIAYVRDIGITDAILRLLRLSVPVFAKFPSSLDLIAGIGLGFRFSDIVFSFSVRNSPLDNQWSVNFMKSATVSFSEPSEEWTKRAVELLKNGDDASIVICSAYSELLLDFASMIVNSAKYRICNSYSEFHAGVIATLASVLCAIVSMSPQFSRENLDSESCTSTCRKYLSRFVEEDSRLCSPQKLTVLDVRNDQFISAPLLDDLLACDTIRSFFGKLIDLAGTYPELLFNKDAQLPSFLSWVRSVFENNGQFACRALPQFTDIVRSDFPIFQLYFVDFLSKLVSSDVKNLSPLEGAGVFQLVLLDSFCLCYGDCRKPLIQSAQRSWIQMLGYFATVPGKSNAEVLRTLMQLLSRQNLHPMLRKNASIGLLQIFLARCSFSTECLLNVDSWKRLFLFAVASGQELSTDARNLSSDSGVLDGLHAEVAIRKLTDIIMFSDQTKTQLIADPPMIDQLFAFLRTPALRKFAARHISVLMTADAIDEDLHISLFRRFLETFPPLQSAPTWENMQLLDDLLVVLREVLGKDSKKKLQKLFQKAEAFVKLVNMLNVPDEMFSSVTNFSSSDLCINILETLRYLLSENPKNQRIFKQDLGYDRLAELIRRCLHDSRPELRVFDTLFRLLLDVEETISCQTSRPIQNEGMMNVIFNLLRDASDDVVATVLKRSVAIVALSTNNRARCADSKVMMEMISLLDHVRGPSVDDVFRLIELIGQHSVSVTELKALFHYMKMICVDKSQTEMLNKALHVVENMTRKDGPNAFFDFDGMASGLELSPLVKFPSSKGYSIAAWFRIESFEDPTDMPKYQPRLFSFFSASAAPPTIGPAANASSSVASPTGNAPASPSSDFGDEKKKDATSDITGIEALFDSSFLIVRNFSGGRMISEKIFKYPFLEKQWYFVVISHSISKGLSFSKSEIKLYVNGRMEERFPLKFPKVSREFSQCRIACNSLVDSMKLYRENPLWGQMGNIYLFDDVISSGQVSVMYELGPNVLTTFHPAEIPMVTDTEQKQSVTFDGSLSSKLYLSYNAKACEQWKYAFDCSGKPDKNDARIRRGTQRCVTHSVRDLIGCLGGIQVLLPFFLFLNTHHIDRGTEGLIVSRLLSLVIELVRDHRDNQEDLERCHGLAVIGYLLKKTNPVHLTIDILRRLKDAITCFERNDSLYRRAVLCFFFDTDIWTRASGEIQRQWLETCFEYVAKDASDTSFTGHFLRRDFGVQGYLDLIRNHYTSDRILPVVPKSMELGDGFAMSPAPVSRTSSTGSVAFASVRSTLLNTRDIGGLRKLVVETVKTLVSGSPNSKEVQSLVRFLSVSKDPSAIQDVLGLFLDFAFLNSQFALMALAEANAIDLLTYLLASENARVRVLALKALSRLWEKYPACVADPLGLSTVIQNLTLYPLEKDGMHILFAILISEVALMTEEVDFNKAQCRIIHPSILIILFRSAFNASPSLRILVMRNLLELFRPSLSHRAQNISCFGDVLNWQWYIFRLLIRQKAEASADLYVQLEVLIIDLFKVVFTEALLSKKHGWRVVEDSILLFHRVLIANVRKEEYYVLSESNVPDVAPPLVDHIVFQRSLISHILHHFSYCLKDGTLPSVMKLNDGIALENIAHFVILVEDFLFYTCPDLELNYFEEKDHKYSSALTGRELEGFRHHVVFPHMHVGDEEDSFAHVWEDIDLAEILVSLLDAWQLLTIADFDAFHPLRSSSKHVHFRSGGTIRIALRLIRQSLLRNPAKAAANVRRLQTILERDEEAEKERLRFSELWTVTGDVEENDEFHVRFMHVLAIAYEAYRLYVEKNFVPHDAEVANLIFFMFRRRPDLLKDHIHKNNYSIYDAYPSLRTGNASPSLLQEVICDETWNRYFTSYLKVFRNNEENQETTFIPGLIELRVNRLRYLVEQMDGRIRDSGVTRQVQEDRILRLRKEITEETTTRFRMVKEEKKALEVTSENILNRILRIVQDERGAWSLVSFVRSHQDRKSKKRQVSRIAKNRVRALRATESAPVDDPSDSPSVIAPPTPGGRSASADSGFADSIDGDVSSDRRLVSNGDSTSDDEAAVSDGEEDSFVVKEAPEMFWKLDRTEDSLGAHRRIKRNYEGHRHTGASNNRDRRSNKLENVESAQEAVAKSLQSLLSTSTAIPSSAAEEEDNAIVDLESELASMTNSETTSDSSVATSATATAGASSLATNPFELTAGLPTFSEEKHVFSCESQMVWPMYTIAGSLEITTLGLYFRPSDDEKIPEIISKRPPKIRFWPKEDIIDIRLRRFKLVKSGLEIHFADRKSVFLNFPEGKAKVRNRVISKILSVRPPRLRQSFALSPEEELKRSNITELWRRRQLSNFEYLMRLNDLAGRSYNDLSQYPVFPWILADYASEVLDLTNPKSFRDLSKPMGAQNPDLLEVVLERYHGMQGDSSIPAFHYGSHYSSAGVVLYYMIRLEPFTSYHILLQAGKFDHADRLFFDISNTYNNILTNMSDVKELIPEFFYLPHMFRNLNNLDMGTRQTGLKLGDVILPKWAKGSSEEFVRLHREALESDYVSERLNDWIDLIFGWRQRGQAAVDAHNLFYYLTYEGAVDLETIEDPIVRASMEAQIENFGQTPSQLFKKPHLKRIKADPYNGHFLSRPSAMKAYFELTKASSTAIVFLQMRGDRVFSACAAGTFGIHRIALSNLSSSAAAMEGPIVSPGGVQLPSDKSGEQSKASGVASLPFVFYVDPSMPTRKRMATASHALTKPASSSYSIGVIGGKEVSFSAGHWDGSFKCAVVVSGQLVQSMWRHRDLVTCLSVSRDSRTLVTGSRDTTVMVWDIFPTATSSNSTSSSSQSLSNASIAANSGMATPAASTSTMGAVSLAGVTSQSLIASSYNHSKHTYGYGVSSLPISQFPRHVLFGHDMEVTCVAVNEELDLVVSGSEDGSLMLHSLIKGRYIRSLYHPNRCAVDLLAVSRNGDIVFYSKLDFCMFAYSINGQLLKAEDAGECLHAIVLSDDGRYVLTGGISKVLTIRRLHNLEVVYRFPSIDKVITSLEVSADQRYVFIGTSEGSIIVYSVNLSALRDAPAIDV
ncbi:conserved mitochondrial BEACH domain-containing protein [Andalucia godoyi]|uniref:Conserved mitochondrial BEACH domain-containing protein n=1 Tax=Andalucia godoyi TaxID=505711 RepID=A0A8K0AI84_ANDGO|nr:conserved mitochondrial BEACH domain-containing protein [Andalucia godoyi]|eukprot:ANDGO_01621.mRNA.1 conserved mitochondrial BEACH domain-containing protein